MNNRISHQIQVAKERNKIISSSFDKNPLQALVGPKQPFKSNCSKEDFILNFSKAEGARKEYNSLLDRNLIGFFTKERFRKHLIKMELVFSQSDIAKR